MEHGYCSICGEELPLEELEELDDQLFCPACWEQETVTCSRCGTRLLAEDNAGDERTPLCQSCYDRAYTTCVRCGRVILYDDAFYLDDDEDEPYCYCCHDYARRESVIQDYYYKPEPIFYGDGSRYFGVELEVDEAGENGRHAQKVLDIANRACDRLYCKHDGSLDDGFEMVSHPMTLDYHRDKMPWKEIMETVVGMGYTSHQARTCGLHVHVNRDAFGATESAQDAAIARVLYFFEKHWEELLKFSRRTQRQLDHWAARYGYKDHPMEILDHAKKSCRSSRYTCVNLTNTDTIEFRMFRGTLKYSTFLATLQLVDRICDVAVFLSDQELRDLSWTTFVSGCTAAELVQYLKERRLYINEPVDGEEEV